MPYLLSEAVIDFTIVDDYHFKITGKDTEKLNGYYLSEEESKSVLIFPGSEKLRYLLPFKLPEETICYLKDRLNSEVSDLTITFADDGEKFGLWPGTNKWVYRDGWLKNFFAALEANKEWINTSTFSEHINRSKPTGRIYLPCASYREMLEWSGGFFRNFLVKYPEANNMHKKMFLISRRLEELEENQNIPEEKIVATKKYLYMGQFNDAYWHGVFGGLYLNHLRSSVYENLIKAENLIEELEKSKDKVTKLDFDNDGKTEIMVSTKKMRLCFRPDEGATLSEWDDKLKCFNLTNTISRRFEHYHNQLKEKLQQSLNNTDQGSQPLSIHDQKNIKDMDLDKLLFYDRYPRYSLRDYLLDTKTSLEDFYKGKFTEITRLADSSYEFIDKTDGNKKIIEFSRKEIIDLCLVKITKRVAIIDNSISINYSLENFGIKKIDFIFGTEFNLSLYDAELCETANEEKSSSEFVINDLWKQIKVEYSIKPETKIWSFPIQTVSDSESGIEKMHQGLCVFFNWPITLAQNGQFRINLEAKLD
jgi:alpha-amylase